MKENIINMIVKLLTFLSSLKNLGYTMMRLAIFIIFVWIGALKFANYEAEGIVPFVANSPMMNFFYTKEAPEYKNFKLKEGEADQVKQTWHKENNTYGFSKALGILIMGIGILTVLGFFCTKIGFIGELLVIIMTLGTLSFLLTTPECFVPDLGSGEHGFPLLSGAGRLVVKDLAILASAVVLISQSSSKLLSGGCKR